MKPRIDSMDELHRIREQIYEEEKDLSPQEQLKRLHQESEAFLKRAGLKLKRVAPPSTVAH
jgi:hypothetical protein